MDWRNRAACLDEDPELFFPIGNTGPALLQIEEAKQVCRRCDVRDACLQWALEAGQDHGVWGGLSEDERRALKRRAARATARDQTGSSTIALVPGPLGCGPSSKLPSISPTSVSTMDRPRLRDWRQSKPGGRPRPSSLISTRNLPSAKDGSTCTWPGVSASPCSTAF